MPSRAPVILRKRAAASATAVTVQRTIIRPPRHPLRAARELADRSIKFSIAFGFESWRSSFDGRPRRFTVGLEPREFSRGSV